MPSSRTETESESTDFFTKPAKTDRLQDFENRNNTTTVDVTSETIIEKTIDFKQAIIFVNTA